MQKLMETRCHQCQSITCFKILYYEFVNVHVKFQVLNLILIQKKNYTLGYKSESLIYFLLKYLRVDSTHLYLHI